jgi:hypothetical protein
MPAAHILIAYLQAIELIERFFSQSPIHHPT